jgi:hypothetical protein
VTVDDVTQQSWFLALEGRRVPGGQSAAWVVRVTAVAPAAEGAYIQLVPEHAPTESILLAVSEQADADAALAALAELDLQSAASLPRLVRISC